MQLDKAFAWASPLAVLAVVVAGIGLGAWAYVYQHEFDPPVKPTQETAQPATTSTQPDVQNQQAQQLVPGYYVSARYGFEFQYPDDWRVETDKLDIEATNGSNYTQLYNYSSSEVSDAPGWGKGHNKIELFRVTDDGSADASAGTTQIATAVTVDGISALRVESSGDSNWVSYRVPLQSGEREFLRINIYGDSTNFYVLDNVMSTFRLSR